MQGWTAPTRNGVTTKSRAKKLKRTENLFKEPTVNRCLLILDLKPYKSKETFYLQRIPESSCAEKETVDIDI